VRLYTVSAVVEQEVKVISGKKSYIDKTDGKISSRSNCEAFRDEHLAKGHKVSPIRKWRGSSKTHRKSRSGKGRKRVNE
jgi:hypothetical protein